MENNDKIDIMIEMKKISILNEPNFSNVWELLQWYDSEQSVLDLFEFANEVETVTQGEKNLNKAPVKKLD